MSARLENLQPNASVRGILPDCLVTVVGVQWFGSEALELTYKDPGGRVANQLLYRHELKLQEQAGKANARVNSQEARRRADELQGRLRKRMEQLDLEGQISALPPVILGGLVVVPLGLLAKITGQPVSTVKDAVDRLAVAAHAREIIMNVERSLGFEPVDREFEKVGYDIESKDPKTGKLRFIEVKDRASGEQTLTISRNEILYSLSIQELSIISLPAAMHAVSCGVALWLAVSCLLSEG